MTFKKIVLISGIVGAVGYYWFKAQLTVWQQHFSKMKITPTGVTLTGGKFNDFNPYVTFDLDLKITNPTNQAFNPNGIVATLKKIVFYDMNNNFLGFVTVNTNALTIPANSNAVISNIPVVLDTKSVVFNILNSIKVGGFIASKLKTEAIISVLGLEYKIAA